MTKNLLGQDTINQLTPLHLEKRKFYQGDNQINLTQLSEIINTYPDSSKRIKLQHYYTRLLRNKKGKNIGLGFTISLIPFTFISVGVMVTLGHGETTYLAPYFCAPLAIALTVTVVDNVVYNKMRKRIVRLYNSSIANR
jgi:hypothetical protein